MTPREAIEVEIERTKVEWEDKCCSYWYRDGLRFALSFLPKRPIHRTKSRKTKRVSDTKVKK